MDTKGYKGKRHHRRSFLKRVMNYVKIIWIQRTGKDKGKLMKELMVRVKGKADGKMVNKVVSEYCKNKD